MTDTESPANVTNTGEGADAQVSQMNGSIRSAGAMNKGNSSLHSGVAPRATPTTSSSTSSLHPTISPSTASFGSSLSIAEISRMTQGFSSARAHKRMSLDGRTTRIRSSLPSPIGADTAMSSSSSKTYNPLHRSSLAGRSMPMPMSAVGRSFGDKVVLTPTTGISEHIRPQHHRHSISERPRRSSFSEKDIGAGLRDARLTSLAQARGLVVATVKSVSGKPLESPGLQTGRSIVSVGGDLQSPGLSMTAENALSEAAKEPNVKPRTDVILCKFYHTPGLTCTSRPCRFVHDITPTSSPSASDFRASISRRTSAARQDSVTVEEVEGEDLVEELIEVYPMSGGGGGPGSKFSKQKFRTVPCRDFLAGCCLYGDYCSFLHAASHVPGIPEEGSPVVADAALMDDVASELQPTLKPVLDRTESAPASIHVGSIKDVESAKTSPARLASAVEPVLKRLATKFNKGNITIPEYEWTEGKATIAWPTTATRQDFVKSNSILDWAVEPSPRSAAFTAHPPPRTGITLEVPSPTPRVPELDQSPLLPISAYTFSTDSVPATPANGDGEEDVEPMPVTTADNLTSQMPSAQQPDTQAFERDTQGQAVPVHDFSAVYIWGGANDHTLWRPASTPQQSTHDVAETVFKPGSQVMKTLRSGVEVAVPPQVLQNKTNYRTKPCRFFAEGFCPHGPDCGYLHITLPATAAAASIPILSFRTEPCKFFNSANGCHSGDNCAYLHQHVMQPGQPMVLRPRPWRTKPCRHFLKGTCLAGPACHFAHVQPNAQPAQPKGEPTQGAIPSSSGPAKTDLARARVIPELTPCKHFMSAQGCRMGDRCKFNHALAISPPADRKTEGQAEMLAPPEEQDDGVTPKVELSTFISDCSTEGETFPATSAPITIPKHGLSSTQRRGRGQADVPLNVGERVLDIELGQAPNDDEDEVEIAHTPVQEGLLQGLIALRASSPPAGG